MKVTETALPGVLILQPEVYRDDRGYFIETFREANLAAVGIDYRFIQDNLSVSKQGALRGLHLQHPHGQAKLVYAVSGSVFDVCVDVRVGSPAFGKWFGQKLCAEEGTQLLIPPGFAHGFCALTETATFAYKCSEVYSPESQLTVAWNDPKIGIDWPVSSPLLSAKDAEALPLFELIDRLPRFEGN